MPVIYVAKTSSYARRITFVLGQTVEKQHDPWLFLRANRRTVFVLPHSQGSFSGATVPESVHRCKNPVRHPAWPHEPVCEKRLAGRAEPGVHYRKSIELLTKTLVSELHESLSFWRTSILRVRNDHFRRLPSEGTISKVALSAGETSTLTNLENWRVQLFGTSIMILP